MESSTRIVFMGTPDFAVASLRALVDAGKNVVGVITAPDRPAGRGKKMRASAVKLAAEGLGLPILQPEKLKDPDFLEELQRWDPEIGVVVAFRMLPEAVWAMPRLGTFNLHASLLPQYRGAAPINWAIINGEHRSGVTTFLLDHEIDTGNILKQVECSISPEDNAGDLHDRLMGIGADLVVDTVEGLEKGELVPKAQEVTGELKNAPKIFKEDCRLDLGMPAQKVLNRIRGLSPYPGAYIRLRTDDSSLFFKIFSARPYPGHVDLGRLAVQEGKLVMGCADGALELLEVQLEGKKRLPASALLNGWSPEGHEIEI